MKIVLRIFLVGVLVAGAFVGGRAWERLCFPLSGVEATVNGKAMDAEAYTCPNGLVFVDIPGEWPILIAKDTNSAYYPGTQFHHILGMVFAHDPEPGGVSLNDGVKVEEDRELQFTESGLSYTDIESKNRIEITFTK